MIVYNVTCSMEPHLADEWLQWMREVHIPEVMATGCFLEWKILRLMTSAQDDLGVNYAIQYSAENLEKYETYRDQYGPILQQKTRDKYGESILAFRTLLEDITQ